MTTPTILPADAATRDRSTLLRSAEVRFRICGANPTWVHLCAELLKGSDVKICTVIRFSAQRDYRRSKAFETETAIKQGATEIDMVINVGALKARDIETVAKRYSRRGQSGALTRRDRQSDHRNRVVDR
ncbi:MAG: hypothetical protein U0X93_03810 [Anaerolineales bacterium]